MTGRTHIISAVVLGLAVATKYDLSISYLAPCVLGGLWPDTDTKKSLLGRWFPLWLLFRPHRKSLLHSLFGSIAFSAPWLPIEVHAGIFFWLGYMSHLILDTFNATGVRWFYPSDAMVSLASVKIGGIGEIIVAFGWYCLIVYMMGLL